MMTECQMVRHGQSWAFVNASSGYETIPSGNIEGGDPTKDTDLPFLPGAVA